MRKRVKVDGYRLFELIEKGIPKRYFSKENKERY